MKSIAYDIIVTRCYPNQNNRLYDVKIKNNICEVGGRYRVNGTKNEELKTIKSIDADIDIPYDNCNVADKLTLLSVLITHNRLDVEQNNIKDIVDSFGIVDLDITTAIIDGDNYYYEVNDKDDENQHIVSSKPDSEKQIKDKIKELVDYEFDKACQQLANMHNAGLCIGSIPTTKTFIDSNTTLLTLKSLYNNTKDPSVRTLLLGLVIGSNRTANIEANVLHVISILYSL